MPDWLKTAIVGFIAGAVSILIFHQGSLWVAQAMGLLKPTLYNMKPLPPWGVPTIVSQCFWGGLWGVVAAFAVERFPGYLKGWPGWVLVGAVAATLVNWFVVAPIKGAPIGYGFRVPGLYVVLVVYAVWGFGMWLIARILRQALRWP
jgi:hypothetical protein